MLYQLCFLLLLLPTLFGVKGWNSFAKHYFKFSVFSVLEYVVIFLVLFMQMELCIMLLECCSQERTYLRYYGLLGQRFCMINKIHQENFEKCFVQQYSMIHRLETNKLRNVAKFFAHLLGTDALPWHVLAYIRLTEEDTTSSSRIFIKILFQVTRLPLYLFGWLAWLHVLSLLLC